MENNNTDNREVDIKTGNYIELTEGNYTEAVARDYIQGDYLVHGNILTFNHTEILQYSSEIIKNREFIKTSPYKGLKKFDCEDKDLFFGRDQFLTSLVNELEQSNLILLLGASGSGKSSVVRAGLMPWLGQKWGSQFVKIIFTPDRDPFESFYASLLSKYKQADAQIAREAKADTLHRVITQLKQSDEYWLIVLDQFEELFTTTQGDKREIFINSLIHLNKTKLNSVKIIGTMRADFLDKLSPHPKLVKMTDKHRPMIAEMQSDELRLAIEQPAAHHGVLINPELVQEILKDIQGQAGYLPLLQYTLNLLWETELKQNLIQERTLNLDTYRQLGRVQGALQQHVNTLYETLSPEEKQATQRIFLKLVDIGEDAASGGEWKPVRRRASKSIFTSELEQQVLLKLINESLLVSDFSPETKESTIDITHEILLTSWPQLNGWIKENREAISIRNRLNHDMNLWKRKKSEDELWSGSKLEQVLELRINPNFNQVLGGFSPEENEFIERSVTRRDGQRRKTIFALSTFSLFAFLIAGFAGLQWHNAQLNEIKALSSSSQSLLRSNQEFESILENLRALKKMRSVSPFLRFYRHQEKENIQNKLEETLQEIMTKITEYNRLEKHIDEVLDVNFSPDGNIIASASKDKTVKLWNLSGTEINTLIGHKSQVNQVQFNPTGNRIATASQDGTVKIWTRKGEYITTLKETKKNLESIVSVRFAPNGQTIATGDVGGNVKLWTLEGKLINSFKGHELPILNLSVSPDGKFLATASEDKTVKLWNHNGKLLHTLKGYHTDWIWSVAFSPDSQTVATASRDETVNLWTVDGKWLKTLRGHSNSINSVNFSRDGDKIVTAGSDKNIIIWNKNGEQIHSFLSGHKDWIWKSTFSPNGNMIATGSKDGTVKIWKLNNIPIKQAHSQEIYSIKFNQNEREKLATASHDGTVKLWNAPGNLIKVLRHQSLNSAFTSVDFSPDEKLIAAATNDGHVIIWDSKGSNKVQHIFYKPEQQWIWQVSFSPDSKSIATAGEDGTIILWKLDNKQKQIINAHQDEKNAGVNSVVFSPTGEIIASSSWGKLAKIWTIEGELITCLEGHDDAIHSITFSPDGKIIATASHDKTVKLWTNEGKLIRTIKAHDAGVFRVRFSPDGQTIATASLDKSVKLWSLEGKKLKTYNGHDNDVLSLDFNPDGHSLASGDKGGKLILWNLTSNLLVDACDWVNGYLTNNPNVSESDHNICD
ncbi:WD40 repeat domain-containing protein [Laspinema olomoucense]|uniref:WD40 repeat domain-containing protein n=1 Tax=Laspinema olomoucense TaxID=3231600 RepID=UPI0021BB1DCE|nr:WD40 repeat domain-containing protein [Laspinema sp. D3a]MCT7991821.1 WD40 repeat domain-containing protein [Laspinema sp. D3a]